MRKQSLFTLVLVLLVSAFSIQFAACGDDSSDPAEEGTSTGGTTATSGTTGGGGTTTGGTTTGGTTTGGTTTGGGTTGNTNNGTTGSTTGGTTGTTTGGGTTGTSTGGTSTGECANDWFTGQVFTDAEPDPGSPNGGNAVSTPFTNDSGIDDLLAAAPAVPDGESSADADVDIDVTEATVVATSYNTANTQRANRIFWLGDANGYIKVFFPACVETPVEPSDIACDDPRYPVFPVKVGQKVSFKATRITDFSGVVEVTNAQDWLLNSENNDVYIEDVMGRDLAPADINKLVRVTGTLSEDSTACGGSSNCWDLDYGGTSTIVFRSSSSFINGGDCITFVGAVGAFNGDPQLNAESFDWVWNNSSSGE